LYQYKTTSIEPAAPLPCRAYGIPRTSGRPAPRGAGAWRGSRCSSPAPCSSPSSLSPASRASRSSARCDAPQHAPRIGSFAFAFLRMPIVFTRAQSRRHAVGCARFVVYAHADCNRLNISDAVACTSVVSAGCIRGRGIVPAPHCEERVQAIWLGRGRGGGGAGAELQGRHRGGGDPDQGLTLVPMSSST